MNDSEIANRLREMADEVESEDEQKEPYAVWMTDGCSQYYVPLSDFDARPKESGMPYTCRVGFGYDGRRNIVEMEIVPYSEAEEYANE